MWDKTADIKTKKKQAILKKVKNSRFKNSTKSPIDKNKNRRFRQCVRLAVNYNVVSYVHIPLVS